jgi:hypothetical protein
MFHSKTSIHPPAEYFKHEAARSGGMGCAGAGGSISYRAMTGRKVAATPLAIRRVHNNDII